MPLATRLWFTAPLPIPLDRLPAPPPGEDAGIALEGRPLHAVAWGAQGPPVYLLHGWGGRSEQLAGFVAPLVALGHRVIALDAPSHGRSGPGAFGKRSGSIPEFAAALHAAVAAHGRPHAVIAHSLGATAAAYALRTGLSPARLVLLAPMANPRDVLAAFAARCGFGPRIAAGLERALQQKVGVSWDAFDVPSAVRVVAVPPTLVVHDRHDREIGFRDGQAIVRSWPGARLLATDGLGHRRLLRDGAVLTEVVRFVTAGADAASQQRTA